MVADAINVIIVGTIPMVAVVTTTVDMSIIADVVAPIPLSMLMDVVVEHF